MLWSMINKQRSSIYDLWYVIHARRLIDFFVRCTQHGALELKLHGRCVHATHYTQLGIYIYLYISSRGPKSDKKKWGNCIDLFFLNLVCICRVPRVLNAIILCSSSCSSVPAPHVCCSVLEIVSLRVVVTQPAPPATRSRCWRRTAA